MTDEQGRKRTFLLWRKPDICTLGRHGTPCFAYPQETFPWLLQERFPEYEIVNFGVGGYGTIHSLIQFREALASGRRPKVAIVVYAEFHDERNTFVRKRRKAVAPWNRLGPVLQPHARFGKNGELEISMAQVAYTEFPLMRVLSLSHFLEQKYNERQLMHARAHEVSKELIRELVALAGENDVAFIVAGILDQAATQEMVKYAAETGIPAVDISVSFWVPENTNLPHDGHPSALANQHYASVLGDFLESTLAAKKGN